MRNQFIYTDVITKPPLEEGGVPVIEERKNSFNVDMVIRAITLDDGRILILMDDLHERWQDIPRFQKNGQPLMKNGKQVTRKEKDTYQSEIRISKEDGKRYFEIAEITKDNE